MSTDLLVFSKDRACQLDLLLSTFKEKVRNAGTVSVIYKSTNEKFSAGYQRCRNAHGNVEFIEETDFQVQVKAWLSSSNRSPSVMMVVDDDLFRSDIDLSEVSQILTNNPQLVCYSPKLGLQLTYCYSLNEPQPVPNGNVINGYFVWDWRSAVHDWQYVFSVGGHVFRTSEISAWVSGLKFSNPNNLEDAIQQIKNYFVVPPSALSHVVSKMMNTPVNRVQNTHVNRCGNISHVELNDSYLEGGRLDPSRYYAFLPTACHEDIPVSWRNK